VMRVMRGMGGRGGGWRDCGGSPAGRSPGWRWGSPAPLKRRKSKRSVSMRGMGGRAVEVVLQSVLQVGDGERK
jgi:hypothetical protein